MSHALIYPVPEGVSPSPDYTVWADGRPVFVHVCDVGSFAAFDLSGPVEIVIRPRLPHSLPLVRPLSRRIAASSQDDGVRLTLARPENLYLEFDGLPPLFLFANPPEADKLDPADPTVKYFAAGRVYDAGRIELRSGETLYIEGGAVVRGAVHAADGDRVRVRGRGLLDGTIYEPHALRLMVFEHCRDLSVEGIITIGTPSWNLVLGACDRVDIDNVKLIGWVVTSDGIDVVGSQGVHIHDCFLRNNDDCVAVKSVSYDQRENDALTDWRRDVRDVLVERCVCYNDRAGNALEIGFETQCDVIEDITFRDLDVIGAHGEGGVFTIHNGDRATVRSVLYENIRVEHFYDKLIDFRVMRSRYSRDAERGRIENVRFRDIQTIRDDYNALSLLGGFDSDHAVTGVVIEDLVMGGEKIWTPDALQLFTRCASDVEFR